MSHRNKTKARSQNMDLYVDDVLIPEWEVYNEPDAGQFFAGGLGSVYTRSSVVAPTDKLIGWSAENPLWFLSIQTPSEDGGYKIVMYVYGRGEWGMNGDRPVYKVWNRIA